MGILVSSQTLLFTFLFLSLRDLIHDLHIFRKEYSILSHKVFLELFHLRKIDLHQMQGVHFRGTDWVAFRKV